MIIRGTHCWKFRKSKIQNEINEIGIYPSWFLSKTLNTFCIFSCSHALSRKYFEHFKHYWVIPRQAPAWLKKSGLGNLISNTSNTYLFPIMRRNSSKSMAPLLSSSTWNIDTDSLTYIIFGLCNFMMTIFTFTFQLSRWFLTVPTIAINLTNSAIKTHFSPRQSWRAVCDYL